MCQTYAACLSLRLIEELLCTEGDRAKYHREGNSVTQRAKTNADANCLPEKFDKALTTTTFFLFFFLFWFFVVAFCCCCCCCFSIFFFEENSGMQGKNLMIILMPSFLRCSVFRTD